MFRGLYGIVILTDELTRCWKWSKQRRTSDWNVFFNSFLLKTISVVITCFFSLPFDFSIFPSSLFTSPPPQVKEFIHSELLAQLYSTGDHSDLMNESPEQAAHREHVLRTHTALKEALSILSEISMSTLSTFFSAPVEGPRLQTKIINRK